MNRSIQIVLSLFLAFPIVNTNGQNTEASINIVSGTGNVSLGVVNDITQDNFGYLWFVDQTYQCIVRYDGSILKRYTHDGSNPDSPYALGGANVQSVYSDKEGMIWIGGGGFIDHFNPSTETFTHYRHDLNDSTSLTKGFVTEILEDRLGYLWVGTNNGLDRFDKESKSFTHFKNNPDDEATISNDNIRSLYEDHKGNLWVGTGWEYANDNIGGLNLYDRATNSFSRYLHNPDNPQSLRNNKIKVVYEDEKNNLWIGTKGGLHIKTNNGTIEPVESSSFTDEQNILGGSISAIVQDKNNRIWIGSRNNGYGILDLESKVVIPISKSSVYELFKSNDEFIWARLIDDHKVYQINPVHNKIEYIDEQLTSIYQESSDILWKGSSNGLIRKNLVSSAEQIFKNNPLDQQSLSSNDITSIQADDQGNIWVGTQNGLNRYNPETENFTRYIQPVNQQGQGWRNIINYIYVDKAKDLWVCTGDGLGKYDSNTDQFSWMTTDWSQYSPGGVINSLSVPQLVHMVEDKNKVFWIGTIKGGITRFDAINDEFKHYLNGTIVWQLYIDHDEDLWAAAWNGLYRYNKEMDRFDRHPIEEEIKSIIEDDSHNLWLSGTSGLYKIFEEREQYSIYGSTNGITTEFGMGPSFKVQNDQYLFTTSDNGYYALNPDQLYIRKDSAKLFITNIWIGNDKISTFDESTISEPLILANHINLKHDQNNFSLSLTKVDYHAQDEEEIYYIMEPYDYEWRYVSPEEKINYSMVPPGNYTFRAKTLSNGNGVWIEKNMSITILKPWYKTWWAYSSYAILIFSGFIGLSREQQKRAKEKVIAAAKEKELAQAKEIKKAYSDLKATQAQLIHAEKMASLGELTSGIAHEIQNPLNFVKNFSEVSNELLEEMSEELANGNAEEVKFIADDVKQNLQKIIHHGLRADKIVKGMLEHSRVGNREKTPTNINSLLDENVRLAHQSFINKVNPFDVNIKTDFDVSMEDISIISQDISKVIVNLINNALYAVHKKDNALDSYISISSKKLENKILISIEDNGMGISKKDLNKIFQPFFTTKPAGDGTGLGLSLSYDIIKAHGGDIAVRSEVGHGTEFIISLPLT